MRGPEGVVDARQVGLGEGPVLHESLGQLHTFLKDVRRRAGVAGQRGLNPSATNKVTPDTGYRQGGTGIPPHYPPCPSITLEWGKLGGMIHVVQLSRPGLPASGNSRHSHRV